MTFTEKFQALTPVQREKFYTINDSAGLDAFLAETGAALSREEKARVVELITTGMLPVADEELDNAAGGAQDPQIRALQLNKINNSINNKPGC